MMADANIKPFFQEWLSSSRLLANFASKTFLQVYDTFVASRSITFEKELFAMYCQSLVDKLLVSVWVS